MHQFVQLQRHLGPLKQAGPMETNGSRIMGDLLKTLSKISLFKDAAANQNKTDKGRGIK